MKENTKNGKVNPSTLNLTDTVKRGVGRPKKINITIEPLIKRGRGRPKKVSVVEPQIIDSKDLVMNEEQSIVESEVTMKDINSDKQPKRGRGRPKKVVCHENDMNFEQFRNLINFINLQTVEGFINLQTNKIGFISEVDYVTKQSENVVKDIVLYKEKDKKLENILPTKLYDESVSFIKNDVINNDITLSTNDKTLKAFISEEIRTFFINDILFKRSRSKGLEVMFLNSDNLKKLNKNVEDFMKGIDSYKSKGYINHSRITLLDVMKNRLDYGLVMDGRYILSLVPDADFYRWFLNLIYLTLYYNLLKIEEGNKGDDTDSFYDLNTLIKNLYGKIHPLILNKIQNKGVSVSLVLYNGFDTEFEIEDESKFKNKLLSRQLAINSRMIIKVPLYEKFCLGYIHPLTSEISTKNDSITGGLLNIIEDIRLCIQEVRELKYKNYDAFLLSLKNTLDCTEVFKQLRSNGYLTYIFNFTDVKTSISYPEEYSFIDLIKDSKSLGESFIQKWVQDVLNLIERSGVIVTGQEEKTLNVLTNSKCRWTISLSKSEKVTFSFMKTLFVCCHFTNADLTMLKDFDEIKHHLDIVHKNFVTIGKGLQFEDIKTYIRDTSLLAPMGQKSLEKVGDIYGEEFRKVKIPDNYKRKMSKLLKEDKDLFQSYAIQDSLITLKHANSMEDFNISLNKTGVPLTLSSLGKIYVLNNWKDYSYQKSHKFLIGDTHNLNTPQGIDVWKNAGLFLSYFIGNYKGGRNESFMYGYEKQKIWYDYDLNGAYTTVLAYLGNPNYNKCRLISDKVVKSYKDSDFFMNYVILKVRFRFPSTVKYPSIPCYLDHSTTVYPLEGEALLTGPEYILARNQGCEIKILHGVCIPFYKNREQGIRLIGGTKKEEEEVNYFKPYFDIIHNIQGLRKKYPKGTLQNYLYKEIGNSIYGNIVRGISTKKLFDVKTNSMKNLTANELSNPILGSYTTAIVRSVIGESLHLTHELGGNIVSVTTDGFITDLESLESKMLDLPKEKRPLLNLFRSIRLKLSGTSDGYELKNYGKGIISWCTRGQLGIDSQIKATTGFQTKGYNQNYLTEKFVAIMNGEKEFEFIQQSLRGGNEIYKQGGQVIMQYKERSFKLFYDNRREIIEDSDSTLLDSKPLQSVSKGKEFRELVKVTDEKVYNKVLTKRGNKTYKNVLESAVRTFIKGLLQEKPLFGLEIYRDKFKTYRDIINFVKDCGVTSIRLTNSSISHLKNRKINIKLVDRTDEIEEFVKKLKSKLPMFREEDFYKSKSEDSSNKESSLVLSKTSSDVVIQESISNSEETIPNSEDATIDVTISGEESTLDVRNSEESTLDVSTSSDESLDNS